MRGVGVAVTLVLLLSACGGGGADDGSAPSGETSATPGSPDAGSTASPGSPTAGSSGPQTVAPRDDETPGEPGDGAPSPGDAPTLQKPSVDTESMRAAVRHLALGIGPRLATSAAYRRAGTWVADEFRRLGYDVRREGFRVPGGDSWGVPVDAGRSFNVIADPPSFDPDAPHLVVGAHLDTIAVSPGAEDNASGVAAVRELARLSALHGTRLPVRFIAFGAEEPRGPGDDLHHFGSQHRVAAMSATERDALRAMVSLDRVGVRGAAVPVCNGGTGSRRVVRALVDAAGGIPTNTCEDRASDHWSYEKAGVAVARLGSIPYGGYHSPQDRPRYVDDRQLRRTATIVWRWLQ